MNPSYPKPSADRRPWSEPKLKPVGSIGKILEGGEGKVSVVEADMGDSRKPPGQG